MKSTSNPRGFTLIEIVIIIVVLGILATVAFPVYQDIGSQAKTSACRQSLMSMREAMQIWQSKRILAGAGSAWPPIDTLRTINAVMSIRIPPNPFQASANAPDSIVTGVTKGVTVGTRGGWAYNAATGELWANTSTTIGGSGCGGGTAVGENNW